MESDRLDPFEGLDLAPPDGLLEGVDRPGGPKVDGMSDEAVLAWLDELGEELGVAPETPPPPAHAPAPPTESRPPLAAPVGRASPYLEERLAGAQHALTGLRHGFRELAARSERLRQSTDDLTVELERASEELTFARSHGFFTASADSGRTDGAPGAYEPVRRPRSSCADGRPTAPTEPSETPTYRDFTVNRYNSTIQSLHGRWPTVASVALVAAAVISALLVAVAILTPEGSPPIWLAVLPGVWMIPVPFFVLSFRGTQRILQRNHFRLPEAE